MDVEGTRLQALEDECGRLRKQLVKHGDLQREVEMLKSELEKSLETHSKLQALALAFEEENRLMHEKYSAQLIDQAKLDSLTFDLRHEIDTKAQSYVYLEKRFNKMKEKVDNIEALEEKAYNLEKENKKISEQNEKVKDDFESKKILNFFQKHLKENSLMFFIDDLKQKFGHLLSMLLIYCIQI